MMLYVCDDCGAAEFGMFTEIARFVAPVAVMGTGFRGAAAHCPEKLETSQLTLTDPA